MSDPILNARLEALERNLTQAYLADEWLETLQLKKVGVSEPVAIAFRRAINNEVEPLQQEIANIRKDITRAQASGGSVLNQALIAAWAKYERVYQQSLDIFSECMEFIGGLAFRDKELDKDLCNFADGLIRDSALVSLQQPTIAVPSTKESLTKTLGRIVRMRFPDWSVWTLPMIAHEYGHVVEDEDRELEAFVKRMAAGWAVADNVAETERDAVQSLYAKHIAELTADAFATFTMGPAYACAAVLLRFIPSDPSGDNVREQPTDATRACVVFDILDRMNESAGGRPYTLILEDLKGQWDALLRRAGHDGIVQCGGQDRLKSLTESIWLKFRERLVAASYPVASGENGWNVVTKWAADWRTKLRNPGQDELPIPELTRASKLRDALNLAWLIRREYPEHRERISHAALLLCKNIQDINAGGSTKHIRTPRA